MSIQHNALRTAYEQRVVILLYAIAVLNIRSAMSLYQKDIETDETIHYTSWSLIKALMAK